MLIKFCEAIAKLELGHWDWREVTVNVIHVFKKKWEHSEEAIKTCVCTLVLGSLFYIYYIIDIHRHMLYACNM